MYKNKNVILRHNTINPYSSGLKNQNILSSSCGKLKLKLPSWKVICRFNLPYPVLAHLVFFQSFKIDLLISMQSIFIQGVSFFCYWPGENTVFC